MRIFSITKYKLLADNKRSTSSDPIHSLQLKPFYKNYHLSLQIFIIFIIQNDSISIMKDDSHHFKYFKVNWQTAISHSKASKPGITHLENGQTSILCSCCMNPINKTPVPLCQNSKSLQFLGYGFPLYYIFLKYSIVLVLLLIISYTFLGVIWAYQQNSIFCVKNISQVIINSNKIVYCTSWMILLARVASDLNFNQTVIRITSFGLQLLALVYIRDILRKTNQYYDQREISPSDFSILVQNLPKKKGIHSIMQALLKDTLIFRKQFHIESLIYISPLDRYFELQETKEQLIKQLKDALNDSNQINSNFEAKISPFDDKIKRIQALIENTERQLIAQEQKERKQIQVDEIECQKIIIIINTEKEKHQIIEDFSNCQKQMLIKYFGMNSIDVKFGQAPEPRQIIWQNINQPRSKKVRRTIVSWSIFLLLLTIITVGVYFLLEFKSQEVEKTLEISESNEQKKYQLELIVTFIVYLCLISILLFNKFILSYISKMLTHYQKQKTGGQFEFSFALKNVLGLFFTTAIMTLLVEDITFHNIYSHEYGVIEEQTIMFVFNGLLAPLIWLINPWHLWNSIKRRLLNKTQLLTQEEANQLMELPHYSVGKRYSEVIQCLWFTFLYSSIIPVGSFMIFIGLCLFYWIDKYNLLRKSCVLENVSSHISLKAMTLLDFTLILKPIGELIFDSQIRTSISLSSLVCLGIGILYLCLPINTILDYFHSENFDMADQTYSETKQNFVFNYHTLHPLRGLSERKKTQKHLRFSQLKNGLDKRDKINYEHIESVNQNLSCSEANSPAILINKVYALPPIKNAKCKVNSN